MCMCTDAGSCPLFEPLVPDCRCTLLQPDLSTHPVRVPCSLLVFESEKTFTVGLQEPSGRKPRPDIGDIFGTSFVLQPEETDEYVLLTLL
jgi:hypothetical protein